MTSDEFLRLPIPATTPAPPELVNELLTLEHPDAHCELNHRDAYELLIATVLSAQATDVKVNETTPELFRRFPNAAALAAADAAELEELLRPVGFFRRKSAALLAIAATLVERYDGEVPGELDALVQLAGVGRKTANVVLGNAFDVPGIVVDTHVGRIARRLGWTASTDPLVVEVDIEELFPPSEWVMICHRLIFHGRRVCFARRPRCSACCLLEICPRVGVTNPT